MKGSRWGLSGIALGVALLQTSAIAQQPAGQPQSSAPTQETPASAQDPQKSEKNPNPDTNREGGSKDRILYTLPNYLTVENSRQVSPLTSKQKFKVITRTSFDYVLIPWYGALAGISQAKNNEPGFGQGAAGYGKRFGAYAADGTIENYLTGAILPSALKQDPRYFQLGKGSFVYRSLYSATRIFVTRSDNGKQQFNFSEIVGSALAAGISTFSYHPHADRTLGNALSVWGTQLGADTFTMLGREFWPDIRRKLSKHKRKKTGAS